MSLVYVVLNVFHFVNIFLQGMEQKKSFFVFFAAFSCHLPVHVAARRVQSSPLWPQKLQSSLQLDISTWHPHENVILNFRGSFFFSQQSFCNLVKENLSVFKSVRTPSLLCLDFIVFVTICSAVRILKQILERQRGWISLWSYLFHFFVFLELGMCFPAAVAVAALCSGLAPLAALGNVWVWYLRLKNNLCSCFF